jgi:hypothetical protein
MQRFGVSLMAAKKNQGIVLIMLFICSMVLLPIANGANAKAKATSENFDEFMHYILIGKWELAQHFGQMLIDSKPDAVQVLNLAESNKHATSYQALNRLLTNDAYPEMNGIADGVLKIIEAGRHTQRKDVSRIKVEVARLSSTERGRMMALTRLKDSGEWAVPILIDVLRDPSRSSEFYYISWVLPQIGKQAINPLVTTLLFCDDMSVQIKVAYALERIGYYSALPYLKEISENSNTPHTLKDVCDAALSSILRNYRAKGGDAALQYFSLAEDYYGNESSLSVPENQTLANLWFWDNEKGLVSQAVDRGLFNTLMTMRATERSIKLAPHSEDAIALWLTAFFQLEADGYEQPLFFDEHHANASTFALTAGPEYLHRVLSRSLASRNQAVSLAAIRVLQRNSGQKSLLFALGAKQPLVEALNYPDREVRFNAALTIGGALPNKAFAASNMIVPILAEALNQEGNRFCVIVDQDARRRSAIKDALLDSGNFTDIITDAYYSNAIERARAFASIDLLVISSEIEGPNLSQALELINQDRKFSFCPTVVLSASTKIDDLNTHILQYPFMTVVPENIAVDAIAGYEVEILNDNNAAIFDKNIADYYAQLASKVLLKLALSGNTILPLAPAEKEIIKAVFKQRELIRLDSIQTLARIDSFEAQRALAKYALSLMDDAEEKLLSLNQLALSAKAFGNLLLSEHIEGLITLVQNRESPDDIRNVSAEAYGALNLPSVQISKLILDQQVETLR